MIHLEAWYREADSFDRRLDEIEKKLSRTKWYPLNPGPEEVELMQELDTILRRTGKDYMDLPFYSRLSYFHWKYPDFRHWVRSSFHEVYETPQWKTFVVDMQGKLGERPALSLGRELLESFQGLGNMGAGGEAVPQEDVESADRLLKRWRELMEPLTPKTYEEVSHRPFDQADLSSVGGAFGFWMSPD